MSWLHWVRCHIHPQYDELTSKHIDQLRQLTKQIQDARIARDNDAIKTSLEVRLRVSDVYA